MTRLLEKAFRLVSKLPPEGQDALAQRRLEEIAMEERWPEALKESSESLEQLADQALAEERAGNAQPIDPEARGV